MCQIYVYKICYRVRQSCAITTSCTVWCESAVAYLAISGIWNVSLNIPFTAFLRVFIILFPAAFSQKVTKAWLRRVKQEIILHIFRNSQRVNLVRNTHKHWNLDHFLMRSVVVVETEYPVLHFYKRERINIIWIYEQSSLIYMQFLKMIQ